MAKMQMSYSKTFGTIPVGTVFGDLAQGAIFKLSDDCTTFYMKIKYGTNFYVLDINTGAAQSAFSIDTPIVPYKQAVLTINTQRSLTQ